MGDPRRVLVTGGSGRLGQAFLRHYGDQYDLRLTFHTRPFEAPGHEVVPMDLADYASVLRASQGMEAVVHLGADAGVHSPWSSVLENNLVGTYHVYEAAREAGVRRVVYASSNHAAAMLAADHAAAAQSAGDEPMPVGPEAAIRPDSLYGVSKCFGEALGRYYHDVFGLSVICLRIGSCGGQDDPALARARLHGAAERGERFPYTLAQVLGMFLSARDWTQLVHLSLRTDCPFGIFYGISGNTPATFDLSETRRVLGYAPQDNVQDFFDVPIASLG